MSEVRSVTVVVNGNITGLERAYQRAGSATDDFADKLDRIDKRTNSLDRAQDSLGSSLSGSTRQIRDQALALGRSDHVLANHTNSLKIGKSELERFGITTTRTEKQIDSLSGRLALLTQAAVALGPGVAVAAVPALVGLTTQLGATGLAVGVTIGAFQGVGDALTAVNKSKLEPTVENLRAARTALDDLSPAGAELVTRLADAGPALKELRNAGQQEMFPGILRGLDALSTRLPEARGLFIEVSREVGDLAEKVGKDLSSDDWDAVFTYALSDAPKLIDQTGRSMGNLTHAAANLWVALAPLTGDWSEGLVHATERLEKSSQGLSSSAGLNAFLGYAEDVGPEVVDTLYSLLSALVAVGKAGAPISKPLIEGLGQVADIVSDIADSDLGTPLVAGALALTAYNRALSVRASLSRQIAATEAAPGLVGRAGGASYVADIRNVRTLRADLTSLRRQQLATRDLTGGMVNVPLLRQGAAETGRVTSALKGLGKTAGVVGAVGVATSGMADRIGVGNTAALALAGTLAGPVGAALGATAGAFLDVRHAGDQSIDAFERLDRVAGSTNVLELSSAIGDARKEFNDLKQTTSVGDFISDAFKGYGRVAQGKSFMPDIGELNAQERGYFRLTSTYRGLATLVGKPLPANASTKQIDDFARRAAPALDAAGISIRDLTDHSDFGQLQKGADALRSFGITAQGVSQDAIDLTRNLDNALNPKLGLDAARDKLGETTRALSQLNAQAGLKGQTAGAAGNRALVRSAVADTQALLQAQADAGKGSSVLAGTLSRSRESIVRQGEAAGFTRQEMNRYLNTLGLTPRLVSTLVEANTKSAQSKLRQYLDILGVTPDQKATLMRLAASGATGQLRAYVAKLNLTPGQKRTLITALTAGAKGNIAEVQRLLNSLHDKSVTVSVQKINTTVNRAINEVIGSSLGSARGNILETTDVRRFRLGSDPDDLANAHRPKLYPAGPVARVFREPETMGEAYIPLANDSRRGRAMDITEQVAGRFGGTVQWNAFGSITPGKDEADYKVSVLQAQAEIAEAQSALAARRKNSAGRTVYALTGTARNLKAAELEAAKFNLNEIKAQRNADLSAAQTASTASLTGGGSSSDSGSIFARGASAGGALSSVNRQIKAVSDYGQTIAALRNAGASPALLAQVVQVAESGDLASAVRMGKSLLAQPATLAGLNASLSELNRVSTSVAAFTSAPAFASSGGRLAAPSTGTEVKVVLATDPSEQTRQISRTVTHEVTAALASVVG